MSHLSEAVSGHWDLMDSSESSKSANLSHSPLSPSDLPIFPPTEGGGCQEARRTNLTTYCFTAPLLPHSISNCQGYQIDLSPIIVQTGQTPLSIGGFSGWRIVDI